MAKLFLVCHQAAHALTSFLCMAKRAEQGASRNNRHDTVSDVKVFLEREFPEHVKVIEVVCSSARRDMDRRAKHVPHRLFCETLGLFNEWTANKQPDAEKPQWPTTTDIACWHCCHQFDGVPIPIPKYKKADSDSITLYTVYGVFCSCNCAVAYILERNSYDQQQLLLQFKSMATHVFGFLTADVFALEPAPPRIFLRMFGGHLTIEQFRAASLVARNTLLLPPFISYSMVLEENSRMSGNMSESKQPQGETAVMPITSHVIRGLRRPTVAPAAAPETEPGETEGAALNQWAAADKSEKPASLYEQFIEAKQTGGSDVLMQMAQAEEAAPQAKRRTASRKPAAAKRTAAPSAATAPASSSGTLAAFLQNKSTQ